MNRIILLSLVLSSCIATVQVPFSEPPEIVLPPGAHHLTFLSRFDTSQISYTDKKVVSLYKQSFQAFVAGLKDGFNDIEHLSLQVPDTIISGRWYTNQVPKFPDSTQVVSLLDRFGPSYLITLDALSLEQDSEEQLVNYPDGSLAVETYYIIECSAALAFFGVDGQVIDRMLLSDERYADNEFGRFIMSQTSISKFADIAEPLAYDLGYEYALMFVEYKGYFPRYVYSGKHFKQATELMAEGRWEQAKIILLPLTEHKQTKIAQQAAHNMGVIEEALGNEAQIDKWFTKAGPRRLN